jgi:hypothetical protein
MRSLQDEVAARGAAAVAWRGLERLEVEAYVHVWRGLKCGAASSKSSPKSRPGVAHTSSGLIERPLHDTR